jgi:hypothetical protein
MLVSIKFYVGNAVLSLLHYDECIAVTCAAMRIQVFHYLDLLQLGSNTNDLLYDVSLTSSIPLAFCFHHHEMLYQFQIPSKL